MSNLNLNISLPQNLVLEVLSLINEKDIDLSDYIASQLQAAVQFESLGLDYQEQEALLQQAVYSASAMTVVLQLKKYSLKNGGM
jgi:methanogenic corrinoid protein MtbC1